MTKRRIVFISVLGILTLTLILMAVCIRQNESQEMTFAECEQMGGVAWRVDLYNPEICPSCAEYRECEIEYTDYSGVCPECYGACQECEDQYFLYDSCPECYGPCQACQNEYLNDFESEDERFELCPDCEVCDSCREELNINRMNCPPCIACNECKEENKKYINIGDVCPQLFPCAECMERAGAYPDSCPDGRKKIGEISDAAIWFQCCK